MLDVDHIIAEDRRAVKVPLHVVEARRTRLNEYLKEHAYAPLQKVCADFSISEATARRDLAALARNKQIVRTYGGALSEYTQRFPSFQDRRQSGADAKRRIAAAAWGLIKPNDTCFFDLGTTIFALAEEVRRRPIADLKVLTNSLPVADLLVSGGTTRVWLLGGELLPRQSALIGEAASAALRLHTIDTAFFSAEAANRDGVWNSQAQVASMQQLVLQQTSRRILCLHSEKLDKSGPVFMAAWKQFDLLITDALPAKTKLARACRTQFV